MSLLPRWLYEAIVRGRRPSARRYSTMAVLHLVCPALVRARVRVRVRARARVRVRVSAPP